jgi:predicted O-methyltransferase YrrM
MTASKLLYRSDTGWRRRHVFGVLGLRRPCAECTMSEARLLRAQAAGARRVVELGVAEGGSALQLRSAMATDGCLYLVDPYATGPTRVSFAQIMARRVLASCTNGRVVWLRMTSAQASRAWSDAIDFLHIDADHAYERAAADWSDWHEHVRVGGAVAFHDSAVFSGGWVTPDWGPVRLVESILADGDDWQLAAREDSMSVLRRVA